MKEQSVEHEAMANDWFADIFPFSFLKIVIYRYNMLFNNCRLLFCL